MIDSAFTVREVQHTYRVLDRRWMSIRTEHTFSIEAERPHRLFLREYVWDNEIGIEKPPLITSGRRASGSTMHRLQGPIIRGAKGARLAVIDLGRVLSPGERDELSLSHFFMRVAPEPEAWVSHAAVAGCTKITLKAILPKRSDLRPHLKTQPTDAGPNEWDTHEPLIPHDTPDGYEVSAVVERPVANHRYRLSWDQAVG